MPGGQPPGFAESWRTDGPTSAWSSLARWRDSFGNRTKPQSGALPGAFWADWDPWTGSGNISRAFPEHHPGHVPNRGWWALVRGTFRQLVTRPDSFSARLQRHVVPLTNSLSR